MYNCKIFVTIFIVLNIINIVKSHSWVDKIECVETGEFGYPRKYTRVNIDDTQVHELQGRNMDDSIFIEKSYSEEYPMLKCGIGNTVKFYYNSNGHVSLDSYLSSDIRPRIVINNAQLSRQTFYSIHWNNETELLKRDNVNIGKKFNDDSGLVNYLVKNKSFYDGSCDDREFIRKPCIGTFQIPYNTKPNTYNFIWFWILDSDPNGTGEEYFTSFDIDIKNVVYC